jgi:TRAP transporter 4TM/12TM fusion protein
MPAPLEENAAMAGAATNEHGLPEGFGAGLKGRVAFGIAIAFSAFQIATAAYAFVPSQVLRAMHVAFLLLLGFGLLANLKAKSRAGLAVGWLLGVLGFATGLYQWVFYEDLLLRSGGFLEPQDIAMGVLLLALVFEAARRVMGWPLALITGAFLAYALFGEYLPQPFGHRGYALDQVIDHMSFGTEGVYGIPTYVSASYIFIFVVFAAFLERAGMIALFNDFALGLVGAARGGPAQVCVLSSALMGTISGSGVANVVASGQFTIPLMKRFGFSAAFAGGVEAMSSMGGQIMPPVMGAVAFIMAEALGISYAEVVTAAIVPALLYFGSAFWMVHLEAGKRGLHGMPKSELPNPWDAVRKHWPLVLPLAALVYLLFAGFTPLFAGTMGLALTIVLILGLPLSALIGPFALRTVFWILLGLSAAAFLEFGLGALVAVLLALVVANALFKGGRETRALCRDALAEGAKNALPVGIACALVGVIIGTLTLTGGATAFGAYIVSIGETSLFLSLVLTMLTCLVLGMGIPTIPNYIITSSIAGPALLELGVPLLVSHMFVFYFGIMADLTPPVALAAFAAAPIAKESGLKIGLQAVKIALAGFVVPFMAVYAPVLMLQDGGPHAEAWGYWPAVAYVVAKAVLAIGLWGAATVGHLNGPLSWPARALAALAAFSLVAAIPWTDGLGFALAALFLAWRFLAARDRSTRLGAPERRPGA